MRDENRGLCLIDWEGEGTAGLSGGVRENPLARALFVWMLILCERLECLRQNEGFLVEHRGTSSHTYPAAEPVTMLLQKTNAFILILCVFSQWSSFNRGVQRWIFWDLKISSAAAFWSRWNCWMTVSEIPFSRPIAVQLFNRDKMHAVPIVNV